MARGPPGFREAVTAYREAMTGFARRFNRLVALALGLPATFLDPHFERPTVWLRLVRYPPEPPDAPPDQYGAAPHTDYGFITFLAQDELGGLEVRARDGGWIPAPPIPGTFVVNVAGAPAATSFRRLSSYAHAPKRNPGGAFRATSEPLRASIVGRADAHRRLSPCPSSTSASPTR